MRILVDLLGYTGGRGGTETYVRRLLPGLVDALPDASFVAVTGTAGADGVRAFFPGEVEVVPWVGAGRASWALGEVLAVGRAARRVGADVVWSPANFGPLTRGRVPRVVSVHDVIYHEVRGHGAERVVRAITARLMEATARSARAVVTVSETAATAIARHLGVARDRIEVIPNGGSLGAQVDDPWSCLEPLGIRPGRPIVFSTGNRMPHKNFRGLLAAIAALPPEQRPLTVVGGGGVADPLVAAVHEYALVDDVVLPGWVDDDQLRALYQVATVYACPSLTEGFGLPVVDAMAAGVIVVANDVAVLREVGGAHAFYADARDARAFATAIAQALSLDGDDRADRVAAGRAWAAGFTWDAAAVRLAAVFRRSAEERRS